MSLKELIEFENRADKAIDESLFWRLPLQVVLGGMYSLVDQLLHGSLSGNIPPKVAEGETLAFRLSHLIRYFVKCSTKKVLSGNQAIIDYVNADPTGHEASQLLAYSHFCELMPEARKGNYIVNRRVGGFDLEHPNQEYADTEVKDILLSELALAFGLKPPPPVNFRCGILSRRIGVAAPVFGRFSSDLHIEVMQELYEHAYCNLFEPAILTETGFQTAIGAGQEEYLRFRAAVMAIARFCEQMCSWHRTPIQGGNATARDMDEYGEWVSICWKDDFFFHLVQQMAGLTNDQTEKLLSIYSVDMRVDTPNVMHARDGFFPPIWRLPDRVFFQGNRT